MRLIIAMMSHETNTFSPVPTDLDRFRQRHLLYGDAARDEFDGTGTVMGAYLRLAREAGADISLPIAADAWPSGRVHADAYKHMSGAILEAVAKGADGIMLDLHGAMVAEDAPDGEGDLLTRVRAIAPDTPLCVTLDMHANLTAAIVDNSTVITGYKTYPHVDTFEVAHLAGDILLRHMRGEVNAVMSWGNLPLLAQTLCMGSDDEPMGSLQTMCSEAEKPPVLAATLFGGFPMADFEYAGVSAIVVADGDTGAAARTRDALLEVAWQRREEFVFQGEPLHETIARAKTLQEGPVILLDHADNCGSGGNQDVMTVLAEVISQDLEGVAVGGLWDPEAVQQMTKAGVGAQVTIDLGGKTDMPSIGRKGESVRITGRVRVLTDGEFIMRGPMATGVTAKLGPTAVLDTGKVEIVVISNHYEPHDLGIFTSVGIDPLTRKYLLLKSRIHYRAGFAPIAAHTLTADGTGVTSSDNSLFEFREVRRPIYPLDAIDDPNAS